MPRDREKQSAYSREYHVKNRETILRRKRERHNPESAQKRWLFYRYGLTPQTWAEMFERQGKRCGICRKESARWVVDHNHTTGKIREILCHGCNVGLGFLEDNPDTVRRAAEYLDRHNG
jgi:Recombination endonuclease VII